MNSFPKLSLAALVAIASLIPSTSLRAQASDIPSAQAPQPASGVDQDKRGRVLLDQMVEALGGDAWLHRTTVLFHGHTASFFRGEPTLSTVDFWDYRQFPDATHSEAERIEFTKKRDIVQIWTATNGYEITYKGNKPLPADQVADFLQRRNHSIEAVIHTWLKQPGIVVLSEGTSSVERRMADKVTLLAANNDAVTLELDSSTHLPLRRTYEHRDVQFKDIDEEQEQYDDYHLIHDIQTPFTISRYHNGDLANQRFILNVDYGVAVTPEMFDTDRPLKGKKK
jgi:hypothetical protein